MKFGFILPGGDAVEQLAQAELADRHGWDGVFVWEAAYGVDAWTLLAAMAVRTRHVRPWKLASQVTTLDQLSGGRAILTVGLGATDGSLGRTGEELDRGARGRMLDEGLDVVQGLWRGELDHHGEHYTVELGPRTDLATVAAPVQRPIPVWAVGAWPRPRSMQRVLRCDGLVPDVMPAPGERREATPDDVRAMREWLREHGKGDDFDVVREGETRGIDADADRAVVAPWAEAGCTWWLEARWEMPHEAPERMAEVRRRLEAGPPGPA
jgi:hypothetical protein